MEKKYPANFGLIHDDPRDAGAKARDYRFGMVSAVTNEAVLQPLGHGWKPYLPPLEIQTGVGYDTFACVTYSAIKCIATLIKRKYGISIDKSERFTAKMSGTQPGVGNSLFNVAESVRKLNGSVDQAFWPFPRTDAGFTLQEFYAAVPQAIIAMGPLIFKQFTIQWEWVPANVSDIKAALQFAPLQVTGYAWDSPVNGIYQKSTNTPNHAFELYDYYDGHEWEIYDQYDNDFKRLAWDYSFGAVLKFDVTLTPQVNLTFLQQLQARGLKYVQRVSHGQVYRLDQAGVTFLDVIPDATGHTPLYDEAIHSWVAANKLVGISEDDFTKLTTP